MATAAVRAPGGSDQQPGQARATGCYKCGKPGHWARDCPGPTGNEGGQAAIADGQVGLDGAPGPGTGEPGAPPVGKPKRTRRKVTLDLLKQTSGIPDVYHTFPEVFKRQVQLYEREGNVWADVFVCSFIFQPHAACSW